MDILSITTTLYILVGWNIEETDLYALPDGSDLRFLSTADFHGNGFGDKSTFPR